FTTFATGGSTPRRRAEGFAPRSAPPTVPVPYLLRRLTASLLLLLLVLTLTFVLLRLGPGKPIALPDEQPIPREEQQRLIRSFGLDQPLLTQYGDWLRQI